jgi:hypothetical protein
MESLIISLLYLLGGVLVVMMLAQGLTRKVDLFSIRNIYLAGFIVYQVASPVSALRDGTFIGFRVTDPVGAAKWLMMYVYIFAGIYLFSYHRLKIARWFASKIHVAHGEDTDSMLVGLAIVLILSAFASRMIAMQVPALRAVSINTAVALAAASCALTGWVWGKRRLNPAVLSLVVLVVGMSLIIALGGFFSRRPLISILAGFAWGAYYRWARHLSPSRLLFSTAPLLVVAILVVSAFTAVRGQMGAEAEGQVTLSQMKNANISKGATNLASGQACGAVALWVFDKYPREIDYKHLFSFRYMAYWYIPSAIWPEKPQPLSKETASLARLRRVRVELITLPPGVVGYAAAEGGLYALVLYALFFGQFTRFFDDLIRMNPDNPFIILPVGCTTGNFLGLARGDIGIFTNLALVGFVASFLMIWLTSLAFGRSGSPRMAAPWPQMQ